jgi:hypothetical protein
MDVNDVVEHEDAAAIELSRAIAAVSVDRRERAEVIPGWTTHDVLWHVAYWAGNAADVLEQASQGPPFPEEPDDDAFYDQRNEEMFATGRGMAWDDIVHQFERSRSRMRSALESCAPSASGWAAERAMEEVEHYRDHASQVRAFTEGRPAD